MQGYMDSCLYVTAAMPTPGSFAAFWSEIYAQSCTTCVMLNELDNTYEVKAAFPYIHQSNQQIALSGRRNDVSPILTINYGKQYFGYEVQ